MAFGWPLRYSVHHIPIEELENARLQVDEIGDNAYVALTEVCGSRHVDKLADYFRDNVVNCSREKEKKLHPALKSLKESMCQEPEWLSWADIEQGQFVFLKHLGSAAMGLLYFSLIGGFSAPKIVKVLDGTGYLTSANTDATWRRLNETMSMVIECLQGRAALYPGGDGWMSVLRVRLLHSSVRYRLLNSAGTHRSWDTRTYGLPINQEDMCATLLSFSANILESIDRIALFGLSPTIIQKGASVLSPKDQMSYLHLWRYIGRLIGVQDKYNKCTEVAVAKGAIESVILHLLHPDERSQAVASLVLHSVADRPPLRWPVAKHAQAARMLLGAPLADALNIPVSNYHWICLCVSFGLMAAWSWIVDYIVKPDGQYVARCRHILRAEVNAVLGKFPDGGAMGQYAGKSATGAGTSK